MSAARRSRKRRDVLRTAIVRGYAHSGPSRQTVKRAASGGVQKRQEASAGRARQAQPCEARGRGAVKSASARGRRMRRREQVRGLHVFQRAQESAQQRNPRRWPRAMSRATRGGRQRGRRASSSASIWQIKEVRARGRRNRALFSPEASGGSHGSPSRGDIRVSNSR